MLLFLHKCHQNIKKSFSERGGVGVGGAPRTVCYNHESSVIFTDGHNLSMTLIPTTCYIFMFLCLFLCSINSSVAGAVLPWLAGPATGTVKWTWGTLFDSWGFFIPFHENFVHISYSAETTRGKHRLYWVCNYILMNRWLKLFAYSTLEHCSVRVVNINAVRSVDNFLFCNTIKSASKLNWRFWDSVVLRQKERWHLLTK